MQKSKIEVIAISLVVVLALISVFPTASAEDQDVTTTWIVPADTSLSISYPTGEGEIKFDATGIGQNFTDLKASSQDSGTAALNVTNNGNTALQIDFNWTAAWPTGVNYVNISVGDDTNSTSFSFGSGNATVQQTVVANLAKDTSEEFWFWTTGVEVDEADPGVERTLRIISTNV